MRKIERAITLVYITARVPSIMEKETDLELFTLTTETITESRFRTPQTQTRVNSSVFHVFQSSLSVELNINHGHIYKLVSTLRRFSIFQETVGGEGERFPIDWES